MKPTLHNHIDIEDMYNNLDKYFEKGGKGGGGSSGPTAAEIAERDELNRAEWEWNQMGVDFGKERQEEIDEINKTSAEYDAKAKQFMKDAERLKAEGFENYKIDRELGSRKGESLFEGSRASETLKEGLVRSSHKHMSQTADVRGTGKTTGYTKGRSKGDENAYDDFVEKSKQDNPLLTKNIKYEKGESGSDLWKEDYTYVSKKGPGGITVGDLVADPSIAQDRQKFLDDRVSAWAKESDLRAENLSNFDAPTKAWEQAREGYKRDTEGVKAKQNIDKAARGGAKAKALTTKAKKPTKAGLLGATGKGLGEEDESLLGK